MYWDSVLIILACLGTFCFEPIDSADISCPANQCVHYRKCSRTENIANQILLSTDKEEKARLIDEFKALRCGNFHSQKTVCCDQDKIQNRGR